MSSCNAWLSWSKTPMMMMMSMAFPRKIYNFLPIRGEDDKDNDIEIPVITSTALYRGQCCEKTAAIHRYSLCIIDGWWRHNLYFPVPVSLWAAQHPDTHIKRSLHAHSKYILFGSGEHCFSASNSTLYGWRLRECDDGSWVAGAVAARGRTIKCYLSPKLSHCHNQQHCCLDSRCRLSPNMGPSCFFFPNKICAHIDNNSNDNRTYICTNKSNWFGLIITI